uniref:Fungal lipase-type domain-containing protein n=1 Tax=Guillardia theta (strain CCMP2712) TaxID=905079 RepID=A0A0C3TW99_GUITC
MLDTLHALLDSVGLPDPEYKYNRVVEYIRKVVYPDLPQSHQLVLTGHSLGGGIAHIAAALLNEPVVSFTPPGAYQSLSKHLYWNAKDRRQLHQAAHNRTVTILAENDMIGKLYYPPLSILSSSLSPSLLLLLSCPPSTLLICVVQGEFSTLMEVTLERMNTKQDRTGQDRTGQDRTGQDRTGQDRTGQDRSLAPLTSEFSDQLGPVGCHMLENTICNLIQKCGKDHRWASCHFSYEATPLYEGIFGFLQDSYEQGGTLTSNLLSALLDD